MAWFSWFSRWKASTRRAFIVICLACGPIAALFSVTALMVAASVKPAQHVDVYTEMSNFQHAEYFSRNFLLVWMGGTGEQSKVLTSMSSANPPGITMNPDAVTVVSIDPYDVKRVEAGGKDVEWIFTFAVSFMAPGSGQVQRHPYTTTVVEHEKNFQAVTWPRISTVDQTPIIIGGYYTQGVDPQGALGLRISDFISAYYAAPAVPEGKPTSGGNPLKQYVSDKFTGSGVQNSPFSSASVTNIFSAPHGVVPAQAKPGDTVSVLVTFIGKMSSTTYLTMQVPLKLSMSPNKQWLVDGIDTPVYFGKVSNR